MGPSASTASCLRPQDRLQHCPHTAQAGNEDPAGGAALPGAVWVETALCGPAQTSSDPLLASPRLPTRELFRRQNISATSLWPGSL